MISLPPAFETFKVNYNGSDQKWDITTLVAKCAQEEERLRTQNPDFVNHIRQGGRRNNNNNNNNRSLAPRKIRRVRNPVMVLSKMAPPPLRHSSATTVAKKATSLRTVRSLRSGALRKVMTTLFL